jgi:hypothetical protein
MEPACVTDVLSIVCMLWKHSVLYINAVFVEFPKFRVYNKGSVFSGLHVAESHAPCGHGSVN